MFNVGDLVKINKDGFVARYGPLKYYRSEKAMGIIIKEFYGRAYLVEWIIKTRSHLDIPFYRIKGEILDLVSKTKQ